MFQSPLASKLKKSEHPVQDHVTKPSASHPTTSSSASPLLMSMLTRHQPQRRVDSSVASADGTPITTAAGSNTPQYRTYASVNRNLPEQQQEEQGTWQQPSTTSTTTTTTATALDAPSQAAVSTPTQKTTPLSLGNKSRGALLHTTTSTPEHLRPRTNFKQQLQLLQSGAAASQKPWHHHHHHQQQQQQQQPSSSSIKPHIDAPPPPSTGAATVATAVSIANLSLTGEGAAGGSGAASHPLPPPPALSLDEELEKLSLGTTSAVGVKSKTGYISLAAAGQQQHQQQSSIGPAATALPLSLSSSSRGGRTSHTTPRVEERTTLATATTTTTTTTLSSTVSTPRGRGIRNSQAIELGASAQLTSVLVNSDEQRQQQQQQQETVIQWKPMVSSLPASSKNVVGAGCLKINGAPGTTNMMSSKQNQLTAKKSGFEETMTDEGGITFRLGGGVEELKALQKELRSLAPELTLTSFQQEKQQQQQQLAGASSFLNLVEVPSSAPELIRNLLSSSKTSTTDDDSSLRSSSHLPAEPAAIDSMFEKLHRLQQQGAQLVTQHLIEESNGETSEVRRQGLTVSSSSSYKDTKESRGVEGAVNSPVKKDRKKKEMPPRVSERLERLKVLRERGEQLVALTT